MSLTVSCLLLLLNSLGADVRPLGSDPKVCVCKKAREQNGWCAASNVGFVAGLKIPSKMLFEVLDAHGHDIKPASIRCKLCQKALRSDAYCDRCRMGFVKKKAYTSKLSYFLARASISISQAKQPPCTVCARNQKGSGWCSGCKIGHVDHLRFATREDMKGARTELLRLKEAIRRLPRCETCAVAFFTGGKCRRCSTEKRKR